MSVRPDKTEIIEKAKALTEKGYSMNRAAKELGVCQGTLNRWLLQSGIASKPQEVNREWNQPNLNPGSKPPKTVTIGSCVNCGRPVVVAAFIAERATWPIEHCSRECRNGTADVEEAEAV